MGIKGFDRDLLEENKEALQSETWQRVRDGMKEKKEVIHFTSEKTAENDYGRIWERVVKEYLKSGYNAVDSSSVIVVMGKTYKTLKRSEVTVFYDDTGDTLFDVTNERLEKEYEWLMNGGAGDAAGNTDTKEEKDVDEKGDLVVEQVEEGPEAGEGSQTKRAEDDKPDGVTEVIEENTESEQETPEPEESKNTSKQDSIPVKQRAEEKLKKELADAKDKSFADPIIGYLLERCREDEGLAEDVVQEHKTWQKCFDYIYNQARKQTKGNCAVVRYDVVYEWAEDYFHKGDKEEEKKAKKVAEDKAKREKSATERKVAKGKGNTDRTEKISAPPKSETLKVSPKPKKNRKEVDGQLDLFAMMGM